MVVYLWVLIINYYISFLFFMTKYFNKLYSTSRFAAVVLASIVGVFVVVSTVSATTTISTNINTEGTLTVTGQSALATASTTDVTVAGSLWVNGYATTTASNGNIATKGSVTVGTTGRAVNDLVYGYCTISDSGSITASTTKYFTCTTDSSGNLSATHRVFVQATSSLPANLVVKAASSTAANTIQLEIYNLAITAGAVAPGAISLNYFGIK
jgi:hypothetical protein